MTMEKPPRLVWMQLDSTYASGEATDHFWGARVPAGWLIWNRLNHTIAFVPDVGDHVRATPDDGAAPSATDVRPAP